MSSIIVGAAITFSQPILIEGNSREWIGRLHNHVPPLPCLLRVVVNTNLS